MKLTLFLNLHIPLLKYRYLFFQKVLTYLDESYSEISLINEKLLYAQKTSDSNILLVPLFDFAFESYK